MISPFSSIPFKHAQHFMQHSVLDESGAICLQTSKNFPVVNNTPQQRQILFIQWLILWLLKMNLSEGKGFIQNHTELVP